MQIAITRPVSRSIVDCELTHLERTPIDWAKAQAEHEEYERRLEQAGCVVRALPAQDELPDAVFVEDTAVVLDEVAVITRPGAESRRPETESIAEALAGYRELRFIKSPGQIEGGDVLKVGKKLFVGLTLRTNQEGIDQLRNHIAPFGYEVVAVPVTGCLHLKSAVTEVAEGVLLINRGWLDDSAFAGYGFIEVAEDEPFAANALRIGDAVIFPDNFPNTAMKLQQAGIDLIQVKVSELQKAEAGVTCCSLILTQ